MPICINLTFSLLVWPLHQQPDVLDSLQADPFHTLKEKGRPVSASVFKMLVSFALMFANT